MIKEPERYYEWILWRLRQEKPETPLSKLELKDLLYKVSNRVEILEDQNTLLKKEIAELKDASTN